MKPWEWIRLSWEVVSHLSPWMIQHLIFMISKVEQIFFSYKLFLLFLISYLTATIVQITRSERVSHSVESLCDQVPLSMAFSRKEYWSGKPFPSPGIFLTQGSNPGLPMQADSLLSETAGKPIVTRNSYLI